MTPSIFKDGNNKDTCYNGIGQSIQNKQIVLGSIINVIQRTCVIFNVKENLPMISYTF